MCVQCYSRYNTKLQPVTKEWAQPHPPTLQHRSPLPAPQPFPLASRPKALGSVKWVEDHQQVMDRAVEWAFYSVGTKRLLMLRVPDVLFDVWLIGGGFESSLEVGRSRWTLRMNINRGLHVRSEPREVMKKGIDGEKRRRLFPKVKEGTARE